MGTITMSRIKKSKYTTHIKFEKRNKFIISVFDENMKERVTEERTSLKGAYNFAEAWINEQES